MAELDYLYKRLHSTFIDNAREWIVQLEDGLMQLETSPQDKDLINTIFRTAHNIKSTSGTAGLNDIYRFAHRVEDVLFLIRKDTLTPEKILISSLLEAVDIMWEMVEAAASKKNFDCSRCDEWLREMEGYNDGGH
jgi:two-component system chemotaxis sensor kinase CheA